jgi:drug/metabolite transporter superfamily protein YnfA
MVLERIKANKIAVTLFFFFMAGLCEIGGGYLVWLWLRDGMSWVLGAVGGFSVSIWSSANISTIILSQNLCCIRWYLYRHGCILGMDF